MSQINHNFDEFISALQQVHDALPEGNQAAVVAATAAYDRHAEDCIEQIYRQPLPESMRRRGQERTGQLRDGRTMTIEGSGDDTTGIIDIQGPASDPITNWPGGYAQKRHELDSIPNPYFQEAIDLGSDEAYQDAAEAFASTLKL